MAYKYFTRYRDAQKAMRVLEDHTGYSPSFFIDGRAYRVQLDQIGGEKMTEILEGRIGERLIPEC